MKTPLTVLSGAIFGVMVLLSLQQAQSTLCRIPFITLLPGVYELCAAPPPPNANPTPPPPTPGPTVTPGRIVAIHKSLYAEMGVAVEVPRQVPDLVVLGKVFTEKTVTIEAYGTCEAGIDYDAHPVRIEQSATSVRIVLPPPEVFPCSMTKVRYLVDGGYFAPDKDIYNQLFLDARRDIQRQAEQGTLLEKARERAVREIELNTRRLGIDQVTVVIAKDTASDEQ